MTMATSLQVKMEYPFPASNAVREYDDRLADFEAAWNEKGEYLGDNMKGEVEKITHMGQEFTDDVLRQLKRLKKSINVDDSAAQMHECWCTIRAITEYIRVLETESGVLGEMVGLSVLLDSLGLESE